MGGQVTGTPERLSPWPGHRALAATCLLSARVPGLTGGGMGPRWAGLEDRVRARSSSSRESKIHLACLCFPGGDRKSVV